MPYNIYRKVKVIAIRQEDVSRNTRPQEIADPAKSRSNYHVSVAEIDDVPGTVTISDFRGKLKPGQTVSVAVNDKSDLIALVNHSSGEEASLQYKAMSFSEIFSTLFFVSIPAVLCYVLARKMLETEKYHDFGWGVGGAGVFIVILILRGVFKQFTESGSALRALKDQNTV